MHRRQARISWVGVALAVAACALASGCGRGAPHEGAPGDLVRVTATVRRIPVDSDTYVLVPDGSDGTRYLPDALPEPFRQDGLRVVFDGKLAPSAPDERRVGTPIELRNVQRLDGKRSS